MITPNSDFENWLALSELERIGRVRSWDQCSELGAPPLDEIVESFRRAYGHLRGLRVEGYGDYHGCYSILAGIPFIFDRRLIPQTYLGLSMRPSYSEPVPPEFCGKQVWADENWERFLDRCEGDVRRELGRPDMSREEMMDALRGPSRHKCERRDETE